MREQGHVSLDACAAFLLQDRQRFKPVRMTFNVRGQAYRLTRLTDYQNYRLRKCSIAIEEYFALDYEIARSGHELTLAETYAVCRDLFGERGKGFDEWKGGFAFPFALEVPRAARRPAYLFQVVNFRGSVEYRLRKLVDPNDERLKEPLYYPPDADEFPRKEITGFVCYFVGFLKGYCESLASRWTDCFFQSLTRSANMVLASCRFSISGMSMSGIRLASSERRSQTTNARAKSACSGACNHSNNSSSTWTRSSGPQLFSKRNRAATRFRIEASSASEDPRSCTSKYRICGRYRSSPPGTDLDQCADLGRGRPALFAAVQDHGQYRRKGLGVVFGRGVSHVDGCCPTTTPDPV